MRFCAAELKMFFAATRAFDGVASNDAERRQRPVRTVSFAHLNAASALNCSQTHPIIAKLASPTRSDQSASLAQMSELERAVGMK